MISMNQVSKTFFKGKTNEVRAIRETSLTFPEKGLVMLCGPSGSGKTTLLNVLGGLEYIDSGDIRFGETAVSKRSNRKLDAVRNEKIGYIFQQYHLLPYLTVYDNIELVLKMLGIKSREEMDRRIHYVLEIVGMFKYRYRKASALSGGQQQRVAIARAIAKNPDIIIADEPTGNLDSRNTVEIMNIIKKISEQKLVILVTHERELADFYADRIIQVSDGRIVSDKPNEQRSSLDIRHHNTIYLKDLHRRPLSEPEAPVSIEMYTESEAAAVPGIKLKLITYNDAVYIQVDADDKRKVRFVDRDSEVNIYDEHFKGLDQEAVKQIEFDPDKLVSPAEERTASGAAIPAKDAFISAFKRLRGFSKLQKFMFLSFVLAAMLIAVAIAMIGRIYHIEPDDFQEVDAHYWITNAPAEQLAAPEARAASVNPLEKSETFGVRMRTFYQINQMLSLSAHPSDAALLQETEMVAGRYPAKPREAVLEARIANRLLGMNEYKQAGLTKVDDLIGIELISDSFGSGVPVTVVGISDTDSPTVWMNNGLIYEMAANAAPERLREDGDKQVAPIPVGSWEAMAGYASLTEGRAPEKDGEVVYPVESKTLEGYKIGGPLTDSFSGQTYTIVGFYKLEDAAAGQLDRPSAALGTVFMKADALTALWNATAQKLPVLVYTEQPDETRRYLADRQFELSNMYDKSLKQYKKNLRSSYITLLSFAFVLLAVSLLQLYFIIRSSLLNRVYDIGVFRSLGASRWDVHKMFVIEIALLTTVTSIVGYLIMAFILKEIQHSIGEDVMVFYLPVAYIIGGILLIYAINLASGLYPVYRLTRRSPSQILKQYDA